MMEYKDVLGFIGALIAVSSYILYVWSIVRSNIKPHAFSWLIWAVLAGIGYAAQIVGNAGAGSWVLLVDTAACICIFILALLRGEKGYTSFDWISLSLAFLSLFLWWLTKTPTLSVLLITLVDFFAYLPTYRKSFLKPFEESLTMFMLSSLKFVFVLFAIQTYSIATTFYPASITVMNAVFVMMLLVRRAQVKNR